MTPAADALADPIAWLGLHDAEVRQREIVVAQSEMVEALLAGLGGGGSPVDACANNYEFVTKYQLRMDGKPLYGEHGLDGDYKHWREIYEDIWRFKCIMAGAQTGKTAWLMTDLARNGVGAGYGAMFGYYFPDLHLTRGFSGRFKRFLRSNPELAQMLGAVMGSTAGSGTQTAGTDSIHTMSIGETILFLMTIGGKTATEGLPLRGTYFDEVRRMAKSDIERAQERYSAQREPIDVKVSTANYPKSDIHEYFLAGDQRFFSTACNCPDGVVLSQSFPDCIADLRHATPKLVRSVQHAYSTAGLPYLGMTEAEMGQYPAAAYICPKCGTILVDPREGWWEQQAPNHWARSWQVPQMLSVTYPAGRTLAKFETNTDYQEFVNSALGLPWVDVNKMPLQPEHVDACVDSSLVWGEHLSDAVRRRRLVNCAMGIDVQAGYSIAVIMHRAPNGKMRIVHLEVLRVNEAAVESKRSHWYRAAVLMQRYDVRLCVVDEAPEYSESLAFCNAFPGRVMLANYSLGENAPRMVQWDDEALAEDEKQKGDTASRHRVSMMRTKVIHWMLMRFRNRLNEIPNLGTLIQVLPLQEQDGRMQPIFSAHLRAGREGPASVGFVFRDQICRFIFRDILEDGPEHSAEKAAKRGKTRIVAEHIGGSPDFAHACVYASVACDRIGVPFKARGLG